MDASPPPRLPQQVQIFPDTKMQKSMSRILLRNGTVLSHDATDSKVIVLRNTDVLIQGDSIVRIDNDIPTEEDMEVIDCIDRIICPGFVDTHHHMWQSSLKGRHADETLVDYWATGDIQVHNYTPDDVFYSQLAAAVECIDVGTTTVLNHSFCTESPDQVNSALSATLTSGIRSVFAYSTPNLGIREWTEAGITPADDPCPESALKDIERLTKSQPYGDGRVTIGFGFDAYYLPDERIKGIFERVLKAGVTSVTSHVTKSAIFGNSSTIEHLQRLGLLRTLPNLVLSHCNNLSEQEYSLLSESNTAICCTPEAEAQTALGWPLIFRPHPHLNTSIGTDCHSLCPSFLPHQVRAGLMLARMRTNLPLVDKKQYPRTIVGNTNDAFDALTIQGARALGLEKHVGSLKVGKKADLLIINTSSPVMAAVGELEPVAAVVRYMDVRDIETVMVNGRIRKQHGSILPLSVESVEGEESRQTLSWDDVRLKLLHSHKGIMARASKQNPEHAREYVMSRFGIVESTLVDAGK